MRFFLGLLLFILFLQAMPLASSSAASCTVPHPFFVLHHGRHQLYHQFAPALDTPRSSASEEALPPPLRHCIASSKHVFVGLTIKSCTSLAATAASILHSSASCARCCNQAAAKSSAVFAQKGHWVELCSAALSATTLLPLLLPVRIALPFLPPRTVVLPGRRAAAPAPIAIPAFPAA